MQKLIITYFSFYSFYYIDYLLYYSFSVYALFKLVENNNCCKGNIFLLIAKYFSLKQYIVYRQVDIALLIIATIFFEEYKIRMFNHLPKTKILLFYLIDIILFSLQTILDILIMFFITYYFLLLFHTKFFFASCSLSISLSTNTASPTVFMFETIIERLPFFSLMLQRRGFAAI